MSLALFISKTLNFPFFFQLSPTVVPQLVPQAGFHLRLRLRLEHAQVRRNQAGRGRGQRASRRQGRSQASPAPEGVSFRRCHCWRKWSHDRCLWRSYGGRRINPNLDGPRSEGFNATNGSSRCPVRWSATC